MHRTRIYLTDEQFRYLMSNYGYDFDNLTKRGMPQVREMSSIIQLLIQKDMRSNSEVAEVEEEEEQEV